MPEHKSYLGDSVYADMDEFGTVVLTTENGIPSDPSNVIHIEPEVWEALQRWHQRVLGGGGNAKAGE